MAKNKTIFECEACGNQQAKWMGKCPQCGAWESFIELKPAQIAALNEINSKIAKYGGENGDLNSNLGSFATLGKLAKPITQIEIETVKRRSTGDAELDLVLGGGLVDGSLVLIGGSPGIGKSTLLLKIASNLAKSGENVLYVSGEESPSQIKIRAERLNATDEKLFLLTEINLDLILSEIATRGYKTVIIDSIQTLFSDKISSAPGSISQVREITFELMRLAKSQNISVFIIGHITKDGSIAGPRILEHMVDVVLYFEGDSGKELRILRGFKNRFGSTSEVGIFEMSQNGLVSAKNIASKFFTRGAAVSGSAITAVMEGSRALIVEIQALVCESGYPKRSATGFEKNRLDMILALLERKLEIPLGHYDVFINVTGGVKIAETAADLAVAAAIISSFRNRPISKESIFIGELSLNGEIREVPNLESRLKEASTQRLANAIVPGKLAGSGETSRAGENGGVSRHGGRENSNLGLKIFTPKQLSQVLEWM